jgi:hypothetical protein
MDNFIYGSKFRIEANIGIYFLHPVFFACFFV